jgi:hypothetical protein
MGGETFSMDAGTDIAPLLQGLESVGKRVAAGDCVPSR